MNTTRTSLAPGKLSARRISSTGSSQTASVGATLISFISLPCMKEMVVDVTAGNHLVFPLFSVRRTCEKLECYLKISEKEKYPKAELDRLLVIWCKVVSLAERIYSLDSSLIQALLNKLLFYTLNSYIAKLHCINTSCKSNRAHSINAVGPFFLKDIFFHI